MLASQKGLMHCTRVKLAGYRKARGLHQCNAVQASKRLCVHLARVQVVWLTVVVHSIHSAVSTAAQGVLDVPSAIWNVQDRAVEAQLSGLCSQHLAGQLKAPYKHRALPYEDAYLAKAASMQRRARHQAKG